MSSPTQRSLAYYRKQGFLAAVVERFNPHAMIRQDLFGFADILLISKEETIAIQACVTGDMNKRIAKIEACEAAGKWLACPSRSIWVIGWSKKGARGKRKVWTPTQRLVWIKTQNTTTPSEPA